MQFLVKNPFWNAKHYFLTQFGYNAILFFRMKKELVCSLTLFDKMITFKGWVAVVEQLRSTRVDKNSFEIFLPRVFSVPKVFFSPFFVKRIFVCWLLPQERTVAPKKASEEFYCSWSSRETKVWAWRQSKKMVYKLVEGIILKKLFYCRSVTYYNCTIYASAFRSRIVLDS